MTMGFVIEKKELFGKLAVGRKGSVELAQDGNAYVVTSVGSVEIAPTPAI